MIGHLKLQQFTARRLAMVPALAAAVIGAAAARAETITVTDSVYIGVLDTGTKGAPSSPGSFVDVVGLFNTTQVTIVRDMPNHSISFSFRTEFNGNEVVPGISNPGASRSIHYADIFIDNVSPTSPYDGFNYGISLGGQGATAGVYAVTGGGFATSQDIWGDAGAPQPYTYGASFKFASDPDSSAQLAPVAITSTDLVAGLDVSVAGPAGPSAGFYDLTVTVSWDGATAGGDTNFDQLFRSFDFYWGTGDCDNDGIWGQVPEPTGMLVLGMGVLGLAVVRRRNGSNTRG